MNASISSKSLVPLALLCGVTLGCKDEPSGSSGPVSSQLGYDEARSELVVILNHDLDDGEELRARVRSLAEGDSLDCGAMADQIPTFGSRGSGVYGGQTVTADQFEVPTSPNALRGESADELATREAATYFVDVCVMKGGAVAHQARYSLNQALDRVGENGKFDASDDGVRIESNAAYAEACEAELGPNPLFAPVMDADGNPVPGDYLAASCLNGTPIHTEVDGEPSDRSVAQCDDPQYIYSHCEADARTGANGPRVQSATNDLGTSWVLLCRKSLENEGWYNDIAMIGHNPYTGKTCFFQNQLRGSDSNPTPDSNGLEVPWPGDAVESEASPRQGNQLWGAGPEGGSNKGIGCAGCHDADAFIHSPWIDTALREDGTPVVPRIGVHEGYVEGYNRPYSLIDQADQGWTIPRRLVSPEVAACSKCHSMNAGQWMSPTSRRGSSDANGEGCNFCNSGPWVNRLTGDDTSWARLITESHQGFGDVFWMPPNAGETLTEELWPESEYAAAIDFMIRCGEEPDDAACIWEAAPTEPGNPNELPPIETTGVELARAAVAVLGGKHLDEDGEVVDATDRCSCHSVTRFTVGEDWQGLTDDAVNAGIDLDQDFEALSEGEAKSLVNYMRKDQDDPTSVFDAQRIGVYAAIAQFPYFRRLFDKAYADQAPIKYGKFLARVSMPKGGHPPLTAEEGAIIAKWFVEEDANHYREVIPEQPRPETCDEAIAFLGLSSSGVPTDDAWFQSHLEDMEFEGWHARNVADGINMYGCNGATGGIDCFTSGVTDTTFAGPDVSGARVIKLRDFGFNTSFWTRSSADGRFVGNGGSAVAGFGTTITDLQTGRDIGARGAYDPGFFPNNRAFMMQQPTGLCDQSVLTNESIIADGITFTEPGCTGAQGVDLYQHVAVDLNGGDYFIINSKNKADPGDGNADPVAGFGEDADMRFHPFVFTGNDWDRKETVQVRAPYEGDAVLSPSGRMVISRFAGPDGKGLGYSIRRVEATPAGDGYDVSVDDKIRFVCGPGAKPNVSFGERFAVTHHYENGTVNLYLMDLVTMETHQITDMQGGTRALFPHFRSDGWIYFLVTGPEGDQLMATNAAVLLANGG